MEPVPNGSRTVPPGLVVLDGRAILVSYIGDLLPIVGRPTASSAGRDGGRCNDEAPLERITVLPLVTLSLCRLIGVGGVIGNAAVPGKAGKSGSSGRSNSPAGICLGRNAGGIVTGATVPVVPGMSLELARLFRIGFCASSAAAERAGERGTEATPEDCER